MLMKTPKTKEQTIIDGAMNPWPRAPRVGKHNGLGWHLLQVKSGAEVVIGEFLKPFGYEVYYPKTRVLRKVPKRELTLSQRQAGAVVRRPQLVPIFPGYPYIHYDATDPRCDELFSFAGVYGLHCAGERPIIVDDAFVRHMKALEDENRTIPSETTLRDLFGIGDTVRINTGPFRGFTAIVEELPAKLQQQIDQGSLAELDESMCATIAIAIFGQASRTKLALGSIEKIKS